MLTTNAAHGRMKPAHGVIVANPVTTPMQSPASVGLPCFNHSMPVQTVKAVLAASALFTAAKAAPPVEANAEPPLKPNQPNQSRPVPNATKGRLKRKHKPNRTTKTIHESII